MSYSYTGVDQNYGRRERQSLEFANRARNSAPAGARKPHVGAGIGALPPTPPPSNSAGPDGNLPETYPSYQQHSQPQLRDNRQTPTPSPESDVMEGQFDEYGASLPSVATHPNRRSQVLNLETGEEIQRVLREQQEHLEHLQQQLHHRSKGAASGGGGNQRGERFARGSFDGGFGVPPPQQSSGFPQRAERIARPSFDGGYSQSQSNGYQEQNGYSAVTRMGSTSNSDSRAARTGSPARGTPMAPPRTSSPARTPPQFTGYNRSSGSNIATVERNNSTSSVTSSTSLPGNAPKRTPSLLAATAASARAKDKWLALDGVKPSSGAASSGPGPDRGGRPPMTRSTTAPNMATNPPSLGAPTKNPSASLPRHNRTPSVTLSREAIPTPDASANTPTDHRPPPSRGGPSKVKALVAAFANLDQQAKDVPNGYSSKPFNPVAGASGAEDESENGDDQEDGVIRGSQNFAYQSPAMRIPEHSQSEQYPPQNGASQWQNELAASAAEPSSGMGMAGLRPTSTNANPRPTSVAMTGLPPIKPALGGMPLPVKPAGGYSTARPNSIVGRVVGMDTGKDEDAWKKSTTNGADMRAISSSPVPVQTIVLPNSLQNGPFRSPPQHQKVQQLMNESQERPRSPDGTPLPPNKSPSPPGYPSAPVSTIGIKPSSASSLRSLGSEDDLAEDLPLDSLREEKVPTKRVMSGRNQAPRPLSVLKSADAPRRGPTKSVSFSSEGVRVREVPHREDEAYQYESDPDSEDYSDEDEEEDSEDEDEAEYTDEDYSGEEDYEDESNEEIDPDEDVEETDEEWDEEDGAGPNGEEQPSPMNEQQPADDPLPAPPKINGGILPIQTMSPNRPLPAVTYSTTRVGQEGNQQGLGRKASKDEGQGSVTLHQTPSKSKKAGRASLDGRPSFDSGAQPTAPQLSNRMSVAGIPSWGGAPPPSSSIGTVGKARPISWAANSSALAALSNAFPATSRSSSVKSIGSASFGPKPITGSREEQSSDLSNFMPSRRSFSEKRDLPASGQLGVAQQQAQPSAGAQRSRPVSMVEQKITYPTPPFTPPTSMNGLNSVAEKHEEPDAEDDGEWDSEGDEDQSETGSESGSDYGSDGTGSGTEATESEVETPDKPSPPPRGGGKKQGYGNQYDQQQQQYNSDPTSPQSRKMPRSQESIGSVLSPPPLSPLSTSSYGEKRLGSLRRIPNSSTSRKISFHRSNSIRQSIREHRRPTNMNDNRSEKGSTKGSVDGHSRRDGPRRQAGSVRIGSIRRQVPPSRFTPHNGFEPQYGKRFDANNDRDSGRRSARSGAKPKKQGFWKSLQGIFKLGAGPKK